MSLTKIIALYPWFVVAGFLFSGIGAGLMWLEKTVAEKRKEDIQHSADWSELKRAIDELMHLSPPQGYAVFAQWVKPADREQWRTKVETWLDSQTKNPVLLEDKTALAEWREALDQTRNLLKRWPTAEDDEVFTTLATGVQERVFRVWKRLIFRSPEQPEFLKGAKLPKE